MEANTLDSARLLYVADGAFTIYGFGVGLTPGLEWTLFGSVLEGDHLLLRGPDGTLRRTVVKTVLDPRMTVYMEPRPPLEARKAPIVIPEEIAANTIAPGTEVWL